MTFLSKTEVPMTIVSPILNPDIEYRILQPESTAVRVDIGGGVELQVLQCAAFTPTEILFAEMPAVIRAFLLFLCF